MIPYTVPRDKAKKYSAQTGDLLESLVLAALESQYRYVMILKLGDFNTFYTLYMAQSYYVIKIEEIYVSGWPI